MRLAGVCLMLGVVCGLAEAGDVAGGGQPPTKGLFGESGTERLNTLKGLFFTDATYRPRSGALKFSLSTYILPRPNAEAACKQLGGQLARISSQEMLNFITNWIDPLSSYDGQQLFIAGIQRNNIWFFENDSRQPFLSWHAKEPSSAEINSWQESCLVLERRGGKFKMNDVGCDSLWVRFLCEQHV